MSRFIATTISLYAILDLAYTISWYSQVLKGIEGRGGDIDYPPPLFTLGDPIRLFIAASILSAVAWSGALVRVLPQFRLGHRTILFGRAYSSLKLWWIAERMALLAVIAELLQIILPAYKNYEFLHRRLNTPELLSEYYWNFWPHWRHDYARTVVAAIALILAVVLAFRPSMVRATQDVERSTPTNG